MIFLDERLDAAAEEHKTAKHSATQHFKYSTSAVRVSPTVEKWPHLCWPACCCCTAFPSAGLTARGKCAVWANSSGSGAASALSGWWCSPESGRWSCWPKTNNFQRDELATWVGGWKNSASNAADLQYDTVQYLIIEFSQSRNSFQWRLFGNLSSFLNI